MTTYTTTPHHQHNEPDDKVVVHGKRPPSYPSGERPSEKRQKANRDPKTGERTFCSFCGHTYKSSVVKQVKYHLVLELACIWCIWDNKLQLLK